MSLNLDVSRTSDRPAFSVSKQLALYPFQTERQHVTSDGPGQDAGDRVHHLHLDCSARRRLEHHEHYRVRLFHQQTIHQHLYGFSPHLPRARFDQQQRHQLLRLRPDVVKVSPRAAKICVFQVFAAQKSRTEKRGCDSKHRDNRSVNCV